MKRRRKTPVDVDCGAVSRVVGRTFSSRWTRTMLASRFGALVLVARCWAIVSRFGVVAARFGVLVSRFEVLVVPDAVGITSLDKCKTIVLIRSSCKVLKTMSFRHSNETQTPSYLEQENYQKVFSVALTCKFCSNMGSSRQTWRTNNSSFLVQWIRTKWP